jgi:ribosomal protein S9
MKITEAQLRRIIHEEIVDINSMKPVKVDIDDVNEKWPGAVEKFKTQLHLDNSNMHNCFAVGKTLYAFWINDNEKYASLYPNQESSADAYAYKNGKWTEADTEKTRKLYKTIVPENDYGLGVYGDQKNWKKLTFEQVEQQFPEAISEAVLQESQERLGEGGGNWSPAYTMAFDFMNYNGEPKVIKIKKRMSSEDVEKAETLVDSVEKFNESIGVYTDPVWSKLWAQRMAIPVKNAIRKVPDELRKQLQDAESAWSDTHKEEKKAAIKARSDNEKEVQLAISKILKKYLPNKTTASTNDMLAKRTVKKTWKFFIYKDQLHAQMPPEEDEDTTGDIAEEGIIQTWNEEDKSWES